MEEHLMNSAASHGTTSGIDAVDIVTAYKSLKMAMSKTVKGLGDMKDQINSKGYLKSTMASRQA